ncbi:MAG: ribonuclease P [Candidatus Heimdallarchaeota archaeon]|nr:ribonuclease P [Candidatus Heimdallarchaeota archaeon]
MPTDKPVQFQRNRRKPRRKKTQILSQEDIRDQVISLMEQANETIKTDNDLAQKLAKQARKLQMRTRIKFPSEWKKRFCKHCKSFLYPGKNCRVRLSSSNKVVATLCFNCNRYTRIPYYQRKEGINEGHN